MAKKQSHTLTVDEIRFAIRYWLERHKGFSKSIHQGRITECSRPGTVPLTITVEWEEKDEPEFDGYQIGSWKDEVLAKTA